MWPLCELHFLPENAGRCRRLKCYVDSSDDAIISKTLNGVITTWNAAAKRIFGYEPHEVIGRNISVLLPPERFDEEIAILSKLRAGERVGHLETIRVSKSGQRLNMLITSSPIRDASGQVIGACKIARDITEQRRAEAAIRSQQSAMEHLARFNIMGELSIGLAHEINQPMASILTYAGVTLNAARSANPSLKNIALALENIVNETSRAGVIIRQLRDFIRKRDPSCEMVDVNALIRDAAQMLGHDFTLSGIAVTLKLAIGLPGVLADPVQFVQVLINLMQNARDAMMDPGAGGRELTINSSTDGHEITIDVIDRGCGVTTDQMNCLFDRFFSTKAAGLGMGLAISKTIIDSLGGRLTAAENEQFGMTFTITFPAPNQMMQ